MVSYTPRNYYLTFYQVTVDNLYDVTPHIKEGTNLLEFYHCGGTEESVLKDAQTMCLVEMCYDKDVVVRSKSHASVSNVWRHRALPPLLLCYRV